MVSAITAARGHCWPDLVVSVIRDGERRRIAAAEIERTHEIAEGENETEERGDDQADLRRA